jgi:hypothetical protein
MYVGNSLSTFVGAQEVVSDVYKAERGLWCDTLPYRIDGRFKALVPVDGGVRYMSVAALPTMRGNKPGMLSPNRGQLSRTGFAVNAVAGAEVVHMLELEARAQGYHVDGEQTTGTAGFDSEASSLIAQITALPGIQRREVVPGLRSVVIWSYISEVEFPVSLIFGDVVNLSIDLWRVQEDTDEAVGQTYLVGNTDLESMFSRLVKHPSFQHGGATPLSGRCSFVSLVDLNTILKNVNTAHDLVAKLNGTQVNVSPG